MHRCSLMPIIVYNCWHGSLVHHDRRRVPGRHNLEIDMNIELTADATRFIEGLVVSGQYPSADETIAEGV